MCRPCKCADKSRRCQQQIFHHFCLYFHFLSGYHYICYIIGYTNNSCNNSRLIKHGLVYKIIVSFFIFILSHHIILKFFNMMRNAGL